jgi:1,4-dihydroxy-2-naphthoyl-CoA hydrolase
MSNIWFETPKIEVLNRQIENTACTSLGIKITEIGDDYITGTMPADSRTFQPMGLIHGGSNVLLAETLGSIGANCCVNVSKEYCVGQEINANHIRGVRSGEVTGTAKLVHKGRSSQIWEIRILNDQGKLSCISRLTMAVVKHS